MQVLLQSISAQTNRDHGITLLFPHLQIHVRQTRPFHAKAQISNLKVNFNRETNLS
jgi:hypothetical protein